MIEDKFNKIELSSAQLSDLIAKYISSSDIKSTSLKARECALIYFYNYHLHKKKFYFIPEDILSYKKYLIEKSGLSKHTVRNYLSNLNVFCDYLALCCVIDKNPVKRIKHHIKQQEVELKYFSFNQLNQILEKYRLQKEMKFRDYRNILIPLLLIYTDSNEDNILKLKLRDLTKINTFYHLNYFGKILKLDRALNSIITNYLEIRYLIQGDDFLFITQSKKSNGQKLSIRNLREVANEFVSNNGFNGSPIRILKNTSIFLNFMKTQDLNILTNKFKISNKYILNRYLNEFPKFLDNN